MDLLNLFPELLLILTHYRTFVQRAIPHSSSGCSTDPMCLSDKLPLLKNVRQGLIDPDTPKSAMNKKAHDGTNMQLVVCIYDFVRELGYRLTLLVLRRIQHARPHLLSWRRSLLGGCGYLVWGNTRHRMVRPRCRFNSQWHSKP